MELLFTFIIPQSGWPQLASPCKQVVELNAFIEFEQLNPLIKNNTE
jgi:hypothetical protein